MRYELEEKENRCCWIDLSIKVNKKKDSKVSYNVANSIWTNCDEVILSDVFVRESREVFDAEIRNLKFDESAVNQINSWVNKKNRALLCEAGFHKSP